MRTVRLVAERATPANTAAFGRWLGRDAPVEALPTNFYGDTVTLRKPGGFVTDETLEVTVATIRPRPLRVEWIERHFLHTQAFVPLGGRPMLLVLGAPTPDAALPDVDGLRALVFDGSAGFQLHVGTWHEFPMSADGEVDVLVWLRRDTARDLRHKQGNEAHGPDLDKKDVVARLGVSIEVALGEVTLG